MTRAKSLPAPKIYSCPIYSFSMKGACVRLSATWTDVVEHSTAGLICALPPVRFNWLGWSHRPYFLQ
jgi:hypothetical protein